MRFLSLFSGIEAASVAWKPLGWECAAVAEILPYQSSVIKKHYPDIKNFGDVTKITDADIKALGKLDVVVYGSPCFVAGTKIFTLNNYKNIEDIKVGDLVLTHTGGFKKVLRVGFDYKETYIISAKGIFDTEVTKNHPYYIRTRYKQYSKDFQTFRYVFTEPTWKSVGDIRDIDYIGIPSILNINELSENFVEIDGIYWIPVDSIIKTNTHRIVFNLEVEEDNSYTANNAIVHNCQDMSVAGLRQGLETEKEDTNHASILFFEGLRVFRLAQKYCGARYLLWENVPGALTSNEGKDFGKIISSMVGVSFDSEKLIWGNEGICFGRDSMLEWSVLDAQWFGVAQRRRRLFVVLDTGNWQDRKPILLESKSLRGDNPPSRKKKKNSSKTTSQSLVETIFGEELEQDDIKKPLCFDMQAMGVYGDNDIASTLKARDYKDATDLILEPYTCAIVSNIIGRNPETRSGGNGTGYNEEVMYTLTATDHHAIVYTDDIQYHVRKLTPLEAERLQGFPLTDEKYIITIDDNILKWENEYQKNCVNVEILNHKLQKLVLNAENDKYNQIVKFAENYIHIKNQQIKKHALVYVHINLEQKILEIHNQKKLLLSVNYVEEKKQFHQHIKIDDFVHLLVDINKILDRTIISGKEELQMNVENSHHLKNGKIYVKSFGQIIKDIVSDVELNTNIKQNCMKFITLKDIQNIQNSDLKEVIYLFYVMNVINLFIQDLILIENSYQIEIKISSGWTLVNDKTSDSMRINALGRSMAVPVIKWIGQQIENA